MAGFLSHPLRNFAVAAFTPILLIILGALFGGIFAIAALLYMTVIVFVLDEAVVRIADTLDEEEIAFSADRLSAVLAIGHLITLPLVVLALSGATGIGIGGGLLVFFAAGMFFGQVSNANAHELIHRQSKGLRRLGMWVYISLLFGHHTSAHPKVHHRWVATPDDPNTAEEGESFYEFAPRAWVGSFKAGYEMERHDLERKGGGLNPYVIYLAGGVAMLVLAFLIGGLSGALAYLLLCGYAQMQLLLSDYVQHYGLMREKKADGTYAPVGPEHSWNAPHWYSTHMMLNAPRHSDHHAHPMRPYPSLRLPTALEAPMLPYSLPTMGAMAMIPSLWFRVMDKALDRWDEQNGPGTKSPA